MAIGAGCARQVQPDPCRGDGAGVELTFGSDVERPASKRHRDAQPNEDERHRAHQGAGGKGIPGAEGAHPEGAEPGRRVEARRFQPGEETARPSATAATAQPSALTPLARPGASWRRFRIAKRPEAPP